MKEIVLSFLVNWSYLGLISILVLCGLGLPLPEDIPLLLSGWVVHRGQADLYLMFVAGMLGVLGGDSMLFYLGRKYGNSILEHRLLRRLVTPSRLLWAERQFEKRGAKLIFIGRFTPGGRAVVFLSAGICRVPYWKFLAINGFAALISVPVWILIGATYGGKAEEVLGEKATIVIVSVVAAIIVAWYFVERYWQRRQIRKDAITADFDPQSPGRLPKAGAKLADSSEK